MRPLSYPDASPFSRGQAYRVSSGLFNVQYSALYSIRSDIHNILRTPSVKVVKYIACLDYAGSLAKEQLSPLDSLVPIYYITSI